jgi:hypothetical protein
MRHGPVSFCPASAEECREGKKGTSDFFDNIEPAYQRFRRQLPTQSSPDKNIKIQISKVKNLTTETTEGPKPMS